MAKLYDYECADCMEVEERFTEDENRDSQKCACGARMKRVFPARGIAIHATGLRNGFMVSKAELQNPDSYPGKRARLDAMNGLPNTSEYDEWGTPLSKARTDEDAKRRRKEEGHIIATR
jgi:predicted nucleic acid-binding Zn ribbon protein